jgi:hypothetical protein
MLVSIFAEQNLQRLHKFSMQFDIRRICYEDLFARDAELKRKLSIFAASYNSLFIMGNAAG